MFIPNDARVASIHAIGFTEFGKASPKTSYDCQEYWSLCARTDVATEFFQECPKASHTLFVTLSLRTRRGHSRQLLSLDPSSCTTTGSTATASAGGSRATHLSVLLESLLCLQGVPTLEDPSVVPKICHNFEFMALH
jgi:hypothetical protein